MQDDASRNYWRLRLASSQPAILSHGRRRMRPLGRAEAPGDGEAARSLATDREIFAYFNKDNTIEKGAALNRIIDAWRGDNAAAGLSVLAHPPLPEAFAAALVEQLVELPDREKQSELSVLLSSAQPGVKMLVTQQLNNLFAARADGQRAAERHRANGALATDSAVTVGFEDRRSDYKPLISIEAPLQYELGGNHRSGSTLEPAKGESATGLRSTTVLPAYDPEAVPLSSKPPAPEYHSEACERAFRACQSHAASLRRDGHARAAADLEVKCYECYDRCNSMSEVIHGQTPTQGGRGMIKEGTAPFPRGKVRIRFGRPDVYEPDAEPVDPLDLFK